MAGYESRRMVRCEQDHLVVLDVGMDPHELRGCPVCGAPCIYAGRCWVRQPDLAATAARGAATWRAGPDAVFHRGAGREVHGTLRPRIHAYGYRPLRRARCNTRPSGYSTGQECGSGPGTCRATRSRAKKTGAAPGEVPLGQPLALTAGQRQMVKADPARGQEANTRICRIAGVACTHIYASPAMSPTDRERLAGDGHWPRVWHRTGPAYRGCRSTRVVAGPGVAGTVE
jgi:hypothetical protein